MYTGFDDGMFWAAFGAAWVFGWTVLLIVIWNLRSKRRIEKLKLIHEERMKAMEKGVPLPEFPELADDGTLELHVKASRLNPRWPLGLGALVATVGIGYSIAMLMFSWELAQTWPFGLIGVFLGFGLALYYYLTRQPEE